MSLPVASALGLCHGAGQVTTERRRLRTVQSPMPHGPVLSGLFGTHGAGQVLAAATQSFAQYNPPPQNPPIGSAVQTRPDVTPGDPTRTTPPAQTPPPQVPIEHAGDRGKLSTPMIVGGFLILLVALYFIAK